MSKTVSKISSETSRRGASGDRQGKGGNNGRSSVLSDSGTFFKNIGGSGRPLESLRGIRSISEGSDNKRTIKYRPRY